MSPATPSPACAVARARILVVDDNTSVRTVVVYLLRRAGHDAATAADAESARQLGGFSQWDLLVLDVDLPGMSGPELYRQISTIGPAPPVIFISGRPRDLRQLGMGAPPWVKFMAKPFQVEDFLATVGESLRLESGQTPMD